MNSMAYVQKSFYIYLSWFCTILVLVTEFGFAESIEECKTSVLCYNSGGISRPRWINIPACAEFSSEKYDRDIDNMTNHVKNLQTDYQFYEDRLNELLNRFDMPAYVPMTAPIATSEVKRCIVPVVCKGQASRHIPIWMNLEGGDFLGSNYTTKYRELSDILTNLKKNYRRLIETHPTDEFLSGESSGRGLQSTNQPDIYVTTTLNANAISSPVNTTTTGTDTLDTTTTSFDISTSGIAPKTQLPTTQKSSGCYKILAGDIIDTVVLTKVNETNYTGNSTAGEYTMKFSEPEDKTVNGLSYKIINFCISWNSFADVTEIDLGKVQKHVEENFKQNGEFIGSMVPSDWKLWNNSSFLLWHKVFSHSAGYDKDRERCKKTGGNLPDVKRIDLDWREIIENYKDGVRFWTSNVSHVTLFPNGTRSNEDASYFLCTSAPLNQYCFQVVTNATIAKNILQHLKVDKSFFSEEQYEEVEFYGAYNIFKYRIYTVDTEDHFWENINKFSDDHLQGKVLGSPVPCDWDLWEGEAFAWYKKFNDIFTYNEAEQTCGKYNGELANIITRDSGDEWKRKLWSGSDYWITTTNSLWCKYMSCYQGSVCFSETARCDESKSFVCESELPTVRLSMKIVVKSNNENTSFFVEKLWKIWSDQHYIFRINALIDSTAFETVGVYKIFKFSVFASGYDGNAVRRKLVTAFKNSSDAARALFQTNPAPNDWNPWTEVSSLVWYKIFNEYVTYMEARIKCEELGARLAAITIRVTEIELQNWCTKLYRRNKGKHWIGLDILNKSFEWSDGAIYHKSATPWDTNQPDNNGKIESCVHMWFNNNLWRLNDNICSSKMKFICESD